ncbi:CopD family protein [Planktotalea sp.]|uniref:CopD family protein n=1 Tax=Planktotalea sp. TaxID=2029877 RepID=UPI0025E1EAAC|nr:CopD family protein [Planktotalea sp.]
MSDLLASAYPWIKSLHIMAVISWMAGLFYFPRLLVNHVERDDPTSLLHETYQDMEMKLFKVIMQPAMIATWLFGLCLVFTPGIVDWSMWWPWVKAISVIAMTGFHEWLGKRRKDFINGTNNLTGRQYRLMNEVPTLLMVLIVVSVVVKF